jgi:hypothetical protein
MEKSQPGRRPGDSIIDRYMPGVTEPEREATRENLYDYVAALLRIANRRANEVHEPEIRASEPQALELDSP